MQSNTQRADGGTAQASPTLTEILNLIKVSPGSTADKIHAIAKVINMADAQQKSLLKKIRGV